MMYRNGRASRGPAGGLMAAKSKQLLEPITITLSFLLLVSIIVIGIMMSRTSSHATKLQYLMRELHQASQCSAVLGP